MDDANKEQLEQIKSLLVLLLQKLGASSQEIANAMNMNPSTFRNKYKSRKVGSASIKIKD